MSKSLSNAILTAIGLRKAIIPVEAIWITARELSDNSDDDFFFIDYGENITINADNAKTGDTESHNYIGDGEPIISIDPVPHVIGIEIRTIQVRLNILHPTVENMARGHNLYHAKCQIHRGYLGASDNKFVDDLTPRFLGYVNMPEIILGAEGRPSELRLEIVSHSRQFTRTSHAMWSHEYLNEREDGDTFLEWTNGTEDVPDWWGEESDSGED